MPRPTSRTATPANCRPPPPEVLREADPRIGTLLFEVAWEVCNQVGGIYQVIRSKSPAMVRRWHGRYCLVGPYVESKAAVEFEHAPAPGWLAAVIGSLRDDGLIVHHGRWLMPGNPRVLLLEHRMDQRRLGEVKYRLWKDHGIESPGGDGLIDGAISFGDAVRRLFGAISRAWGGRRRREGPRLDAGRPRARAPRPLPPGGSWPISMSGSGSVALPMIRHEGLPIATVFTTHATLLGRYLASGDDRFYDNLAHIDHEASAARLNVRTQHRIERACAHAAHVFTTVSAITGEECTHLLGRTPDVLVPNGLNIGQLYAAHQMQAWHAEYKERIDLFAMGHFFPSYSFDLERTLYFFTSGRFEPRNKGFDLCLEAMVRLNALLREADAGVTVVFFIVTQRPTTSINPLVLEKRGVLNELRETCRRITQGLGDQLFRRGAAGHKIDLDHLVDDYWRLRYRRTQFALRMNRLPLVVTHNVVDDAHDPVLNQIRQLGLINRAEDPVKVVYHPEFINPVSPLWGIEYEQFVRGCHMGVFPSAYEPWGYTPLECLALGVPAVASDLSGFGRFASEAMLGHEELGLTVLRRRGRSYHDAAADLAQKLLWYCRLRRRDRIALRNAAERYSWEFDWSKLGAAYERAHDLALERATEARG